MPADSPDEPRIAGMPLAASPQDGNGTASSKGVTDMKFPLVVLIVMAFVAAAGAQQTPPAPKTTQSSPRAASGDSAFAMKAGQANFAEIELGKLALQKAMRDEVKQFAQQMVDDRSQHRTSRCRRSSTPNTRSSPIGCRS